MADFYDDGAAGSMRGPSAQRWVNLAGAATSVALILGLAVWGYRLAVRDVHGVPVVRALEGPMRVAPDNPGGVQTAHQGLAVNDVAAVGVAQAPADRLLLAPRPVDLTDEDAAGTIAALPAPVSGRMPGSGALDLPPFGAEPSLPELIVEIAPPSNDPSPALSAIDLAVAEALMGDPDTAGEGEELLALAEALAAGSVPLAGTLGVAGGDAGAGAQVIRANLPAGAIARSPRPLPRPGVAAAAVALAPAPAMAATPVNLGPVSEIDPATLAIGTRLVQLGAFDSEADARAEWDRVAARFAALMEGKAPVLQSAQSGGRTFWRLRAHGFADDADARRFCSALVAEQASCIPVTLR